YEHYLDNLRIEQDCLETAKLEGREEGKTEAMVEMAKNLKSLNIPLDIIIKTTGLSSDEIQML
ncbi:MAG: hypothetical protein K2G52_09465, partial [Muribaculaceae bacterium]|nr:hypothetical protein [Muribaculaceae bacterium]